MCKARERIQYRERERVERIPHLFREMEHEVQKFAYEGIKYIPSFFNTSLKSLKSRCCFARLVFCMAAATLPAKILPWRWTNRSGRDDVMTSSTLSIAAELSRKDWDIRMSMANSAHDCHSEFDGLCSFPLVKRLQREDTSSSAGR